MAGFFCWHDSETRTFLSHYRANVMSPCHHPPLPLSELLVEHCTLNVCGARVVRNQPIECEAPLPEGGTGKCLRREVWVLEFAFFPWWEGGLEQMSYLIMNAGCIPFETTAHRSPFAASRLQAGGAAAMREGGLICRNRIELDAVRSLLSERACERQAQLVRGHPSRD